jgi:ElaB/YqjD/DUF883 family membrane-anchored ribosome-binding protein
VDTGTDVYVEAASKLRNDIESTKAALGEKIQALQHEVRGAFAEASDRMKGTLRHARDAVHPAVQFHRHPFAFCAVAFGVGFLLRQRVVGHREVRGELADKMEPGLASSILPHTARPSLSRAIIEGVAPAALELLSGALLSRR